MSSTPPDSTADAEVESHVVLDPLDREEQHLAPYAMRSRASRGRFHGEPDDSLRTPFQRDRDRVIHCTAFRRLEYKTQVFVNHEGDHYRTRLTHTLEVAQISRSVARTLGLNEDLVEAIALSHDLGHPPFGHAGEDKLDELMTASGGFNHNLHCLRVVDHLEQRYPEFDGLNLSWEVRESIVKHYGRFDREDLAEFEPEKQPLLEAQLVDIGDSLAYDTHDVDDGLRSECLSYADFDDVELWRRSRERAESRWPGRGVEKLRARIVSGIIDIQVQDLVAESRRRITESGATSVADVRAAGEPLIAFSRKMAEMKGAMQEFLLENLYRHERTLKMAEKGKRFIAAIFEEYRREPSQLPEEHRARIADLGADRVICDYVAGMTDRFCMQEYSRLFGSEPDGGMVN